MAEYSEKKQENRRVNDSQNTTQTPSNVSYKSLPTFQLSTEKLKLDLSTKEIPQHINPVQAFGLDDTPKEQKPIKHWTPEVFQRQQKENKTGLPNSLKSGIENLSGHSMDDVKVHYNSSKPTQLNAHAYAQGTDIHLASGQEKHLPHEAWHVVQQKEGRVKPTMQMQGVNINDDTGLEKEADGMGGKALQMKGMRDALALDSVRIPNQSVQLEAYKFSPLKKIKLHKNDEVIEFEIEFSSPKVIQEEYKKKTNQLLMPQDLKRIGTMAWETKDSPDVVVEIVLHYPDLEPAKPNQDIESMSEHTYGDLPNFWTGKNNTSGLREKLRTEMPGIDVSSVSEKEIIADMQKQSKKRKEAKTALPVAPSNFDLSPKLGLKQHEERMIPDDQMESLLSNVGIDDKEGSQPKPILQGAYMSGDRNAIAASLVFNKKVTVHILYDEYVNEHGHIEASKARADVLKNFYINTLKTAEETDPDPATRIIMEKVKNASEAFSIRSGGISKNSVDDNTLELIDLSNAMKPDDEKTKEMAASDEKSFKKNLDWLLENEKNNLKILYSNDDDQPNTKSKAISLAYKYFNAGDQKSVQFAGRVTVVAAKDVQEKIKTTPKTIHIPASFGGSIKQIFNWLCENKGHNVEILHSTNAQSPNAENDTKDNAIKLAFKILRFDNHQDTPIDGRVSVEGVADVQDVYKTQISNLETTGLSPGVATTVAAHAFGKDHEGAQEKLEKAWLGGIHPAEKETLNEWIEKKLKIAPNSVLIWIRRAGAQGHGRPELDMNLFALEQIKYIAKTLGRRSYLIGDEIGPFKAKDHPLLKFWNDIPKMPTILNHTPSDGRLLQMYIISKLKDKGCVIVGMRSGILEPNAMLGMPTISIEGLSAGRVNTRLRRYVGRLPGWKALETVGDIGEDAPAMSFHSTREDIVRLNKHISTETENYNDDTFIELKQLFSKIKLKSIKKIAQNVGFLGIDSDNIIDDAGDLMKYIDNAIDEFKNYIAIGDNKIEALGIKMDDLKPAPSLFADPDSDDDDDEMSVQEKEKYDSYQKQINGINANLKKARYYIELFTNHKKQLEKLVKKATVKIAMEQELNHQKLQIEEMGFLYETLKSHFENE